MSTGGRAPAPVRASAGAALRGAAPVRGRRQALAIRPAAAHAEQQAAQRGAAFAQGRQGLGQGLTRVPAASLRVTGSLGQPLPLPLLGELEAAFGARLGAVRVHHDAAAAAAARALHARAFASGADLYFAAGAYAPQWASGRELIAHEVTHTLQQTAHAGADGLWRALPVQGAGEPQFRLDFDGLRALHGGTAPTTDFNSRADEIKAASVDAATLRTYFDRVLASVATWPAEAVGLLYDMCKRLGLHEQAVKLIERDNYKGGLTLRTGFYSGTLFDLLLQRSSGVWVLQRAIENIPDLKLYRSEWLRLVEAYLFQPALDKPTALVRNLDTAAGAKSRKWQSIADHLEQLRQAYVGATEPLANEWYYHGLEHLNLLDRMRLTHAETERQRGANWSPHEIRRRWHRVGSVRNLAEAVRTMGFLDDQGQPDVARTDAWRPFNEKLADAVITVVEKVEARWTAFDLLQEQMDDPAEKGAPSAAQLEAIARLATSSGLSTRLVEAIVAINQTQKDGSRLPANYVEIAQKRGDAIDKQLREQIDQKLPAWHRGGRSDQVVAGLWLISQVWPVRDQLRFETSPFGEEARPGPRVTVIATTPDLITAHRIAVARRLADLAPTLRSAELMRRAQEVLTATLDTDSQLALLPGDDGKLWTQSAVSKERVLKDFADVPLRGNEPITPYGWLLLYEAEYLTRLKTELQRTLPSDEAGEKLAAGRPDRPGLIGEASKTARADMEAAGRTPQRWSVPADGKHVYFAQRAGGMGFSTALMQRLAAERFYADALAARLVPIVPIADHGLAFVWFWPRYVDMVSHLRALPVYNELVAQARFKSVDAAALEKVGRLPEADWSRTLGEVVKVKLDPAADTPLRFSADELRRIVKAVTDYFVALRRSKESALQPDFQRATRIDRLWTAAWATRGLAMFEADRHRTGLRDDIFEQITRFYFSLLVVFRSELPDSDDTLRIEVDAGTSPRLHLAALLLSIAPAMASALKYEDASVFIAANLGMLEDGLASAAALSARREPERRTWLHADESRDDWLRTRTQTLSALVQDLRSKRSKAQLRQGFTASKKDQTLDVQMRFSSPLPVGERIFPRTGYGFLGSELAGKYYRFLGVHRDFVYHPAFGNEQAQTMRSIRSGYAPPMLFELDGSTPLALKPGEKLLQIEETDADGNSLRIFDVGGTEADHAMLAQVYSGALYWAFASSMANIQAAIETYVSTLVDLAELIPGWGQAITAARIVATIGEFWSEGIYKEMLQIINGDTAEILQGLFGKLSELADPGAVIELLLFGSPALNAALSSSTMITQTKSDKAMQRHAPDKRGKFGALKATFARLKSLGKAFAKRLDGLHTRVQQPMQDARIYTSTRPALSMALHFGATHIYEIQALMVEGAALLAMVDAQDRAADSTLLDKFRQSLGQEQADLGKKIHGLLGQLATLELPARIIDMDGAVQLILAEMMAFVGRRLGLKGKAVVIVLEGSGVLDYFAGKVAHEIVAAGFDPNVYWRDEVIPLVADKFHAARDSLVKDLNDLLARPAFDQMFTPVGKGAPLELKPDASVQYDEPGMQPAPATDRRLQRRPASLPARSEGRPLAPQQRPSLESAFGQDLGHVRVHAGGEGEAMTRAFGADALASGSHVYLRQSLDPRQGRGQEVMHHELAHVLQQSGPRPLGRAASPRPLPARPERGLMLDPSNEAEAHRLAAAVGSRLRGGGAAPPQPAAPGGVGGVQPYTLESLDPYLLYRMLRGMNQLDDIKQQEVALDKHRAAATLARSGDGSAVKALVTELLAVTHKSSRLVVKAPGVFSGAIDVQKAGGDSTLDRILAELKKKLDKQTLEVVASHIAKQAQVPLPPVKVAGSKVAAPVLEYVHPSHFARQLEGYILGKTGVALALGMKTRELLAPNGSKVDELDPAAPLASVSVLHLHLPYLAPNADLAVFAITNTWPAARTDEKQRARLAATVRGDLEGRGVHATVWALFGKDYKFSVLYKRRIDEMMSARLTRDGALDPDKLPPPKVYADADLAQKQTSPIGTRVATYQDANQKAPGRHSHHLTQFLVAEYFANQNEGKQPFKSKAPLPGVTWDGGVVTHISPDPTDASKGIRVGETYGGSSRGGAMPAVSLAASTHMSGNLHITPQPDDLLGTVRKTQAYAVDSTFRSGLPDALKLEHHARRFPAWREAQGDAGVARQIHAHALSTFTHWAKHMNDQLKAHMPGMELEYYKAMAAANTTDTSVKAVAQSATEQAALRALLVNVADTAVAENLRVMGALGWKK